MRRCATADGVRVRGARSGRRGFLFLGDAEGFAAGVAEAVGDDAVVFVVAELSFEACHADHCSDPEAGFSNPIVFFDEGGSSGGGISSGLSRV